MIVQCALVEGVMPDGTTVSATITSVPSMPQDGRDHSVEMMIKGLEQKYPGVQGAAQVGDWIEYNIPDEEERS